MIQVTKIYGIDFDAMNVVVTRKSQKMRNGDAAKGLWSPVAYYPIVNDGKRCGLQMALSWIADKAVLASDEALTLLAIAERQIELQETIKSLAATWAAQMAKETALGAVGDSTDGEKGQGHTNPLPND